MLSALHSLQSLQTALATTTSVQATHSRRAPGRISCYYKRTSNALQRILGEHLAVADRHQLQRISCYYKRTSDCISYYYKRTSNGEHLAVADRHQLVRHAVEIRLLEVVRVRERRALLVVRTLDA